MSVLVDRVHVVHRDTIGGPGAYEHKWVIVATDAQGEGLGYMDISEAGDEAYVEWVEVRPGYRRRGVARALYHELYRWAAEQGLEVRHGWATEAGAATLEALQPELERHAAERRVNKADLLALPRGIFGP